MTESKKNTAVEAIDISYNPKAMAEEIYFQWQNDVLRTTIYPRREVMLTNFLVFYWEIELWAEYKNKDISGEIKDYHGRLPALPRSGW